MRAGLVLCLLGTFFLAGCGDTPRSCGASPLPDSQLGACLKDMFAEMEEPQKEKLRTAHATCDPASIDRPDAAEVAEQCRLASAAISADETLKQTKLDYLFMLMANELDLVENAQRIIAAATDAEERQKAIEKRAKRIAQIRERHQLLRQAITPP